MLNEVSSIKKLIIMIPSTFTSNIKNRMLRTFVIGKLARILAIGRVTHIIIYYDEDPLFDSHALGKYITKVLKYAITPPWLKKLAFPLSPENRYLGVIPPLQIKSHITDEGPIIWSVLKRKEGKFGIIKFRWKSKWFEKKVRLSEISNCGYSIKFPQLILFDIINNSVIPYYALEREEYVGFYPLYFNLDLHKAVKKVEKIFDSTIIGTSKYVEHYKNALERIDFSRNITFVFGGPNRGIFKIKEFVDSDYHTIINLMERQETETLRVEEAIFLTLSKLGFC